MINGKPLTTETTILHVSGFRPAKHRKRHQDELLDFVIGPEGVRSDHGPYKGSNMKAGHGLPLVELTENIHVFRFETDLFFAFPKCRGQRRGIGRIHGTAREGDVARLPAKLRGTQGQ